MYPVNTSSITDTTDGTNIFKESRFSYVRSVDGVIRLKLYNCSNITGLVNLVHKGSQVVVEILNNCLILFTGDTFHAGLSTFHIVDGSYPSNLRLFGYIVEKEYITVNEDITLIQLVFVNIIVLHVRICNNKIFIIQDISFKIS